MRTFGAIPDVLDERDYEYRHAMKAVRIPDVVDYEREMTAVKNQGAKGACVSFALCAIREWQEKDQRERSGLWEDMAEDFLYAQTQVWPGGGSFPRSALKVLQKMGVCPEKFYPYGRGSDKDAMRFSPSLRARNSARRFKIDTYVRIRSPEELMESLAVNGPTSMIAGKWLRGWTDSRRKIGGYPVFYSGQGQTVAYHAYVAVGYDASREVIKCRNSWGSQFGKNGYFYLSLNAWATVSDVWAVVDRKHPLVTIG